MIIIKKSQFFRKKIAVDDNILKNVNGKETMTSGHMAIKDIKTDFPEKIEELEEAVKKYLNTILKHWKLLFPMKLDISK